MHEVHWAALNARQGGDTCGRVARLLSATTVHRDVVTTEIGCAASLPAPIVGGLGRSRTALSQRMVWKAAIHGEAPAQAVQLGQHPRPADPRPGRADLAPAVHPPAPGADARCPLGPGRDGRVRHSHPRGRDSGRRRRRHWLRDDRCAHPADRGGPAYGPAAGARGGRAGNSALSRRRRSGHRARAHP